MIRVLSTIAEQYINSFVKGKIVAIDLNRSDLVCVDSDNKSEENIG